MIVYRICPDLSSANFQLFCCPPPPCPQKDPASRRERRAVRRGLQLRGKGRLPAQLIGQSGELGLAGGIQRAADRDGGGSVGQVLAALKHFGHDLGGHRRPGAVLNKGHRAVLVVALGQVMEELLHEGEYIGVVGRRGQYQLAEAECLRDGLLLSFQMIHQN